MAAELCPAVGPESPREQARLVAFRMIEAVQTDDVGDRLADQLGYAEAQGWDDVVRVLLYASVVQGFVTVSADLAERIDALHDRSRVDGDRAMLVTALASRAELHLTAKAEPLRQQAVLDLSRATAMLPTAGGAALELATAYIACAVAYSVRELWEMEEELYGEVAPLLADCELPMLGAVVLFNRAEANVRLACGLREMDDVDELARLAPFARRAVDAALTGPLPLEWVDEMSVHSHLLAALTDQPSAFDAEWLRQMAPGLNVRTEPICAMLDLADALQASDRHDWAAALRHSEEAARLSHDALGEQARGLALKLAAMAEAFLGGGNARAMRYAEHCAARRWEARLLVVGTARAGLLTEQMRIDRDRHARAALIDELTGLANRRGYHRHLQSLRNVPDPARLAVLLVDIDRFKSVNDTYGHAAGDQVLALVGETLAAGIRSRDLVARLGGDEFVVLLDDFGATAARRRAIDLQQRLDAVSWETVDPGLTLGVSIGVAAGSPGGDPERLVRRADTALYAAKALGGARVELAADDQP